MKSEPKPHSRGQNLAATGGQRYNYSSAIKIFHQKDSGPALLTSSALLPMPAQVAIPGFVCQAARTLLDVTQAWLQTESGVSKKTINDFENGLVEPKIALNNRLRRALERAGASFVCGDAVVGVVVFLRPGATAAAKRDEPN